jgi:hypothetical protein
LPIIPNRRRLTPPEGLIQLTPGKMLPNWTAGPSIRWKESVYGDQQLSCPRI